MTAVLGHVGDRNIQVPVFFPVTAGRRVGAFPGSIVPILPDHADLIQAGDLAAGQLRPAAPYVSSGKACIRDPYAEPDAF